MRGIHSEKGAERVAKNGYWYVRTEDGWRLKHHVVMEAELGRPLQDNERVYFIDGDKKNIVASNLEIRTVKPRSKIALQRKLDDLQKQLDELKAQLSDPASLTDV